MPFSSRKTKAVASNVSRTINSSASRLNPFARFQIDQQTEDTKRPPTSNPFQGLEEVHPVETESKPLVNDPQSKLDALKEELESFSLNVVNGDHDSTHHNTNEVPEATTEDLHETVDEKTGWEKVTKKNKRDQPTREAGPIVKAARSGVESSNWRTGKGTTNVSGWNAPRRHHIGTRFTGRRTRYGAANIFFDIPVAELCWASSFGTWRLVSVMMNPPKATSSTARTAKSIFARVAFPSLLVYIHSASTDCRCSRIMERGLWRRNLRN